MDNSIQAHQKELCNKLWAMANSLKEIAEFVEKEIIEYLPQEAQKDFQDSIVDCRKNEGILKNLKI